MERAYGEIINFIAAGKTSGELMAFCPSESVQERVIELVDRKKVASLSIDEESELDHYMQLEHLMRLAKVRARQLCE